MSESTKITGNFLLVYKGITAKRLERRETRWLLPIKVNHSRAPHLGPEILTDVDGSSVDQNKWLDPAHVTFANLHIYDQDQVESFLMQYGLSGVFCGRHMTPSSGAPEKWFIYPEFMAKWQTLLQREWSTQKPQLWFHPRSIAIDMNAGKLQLVTSDLWTLICISFLSDHSRGRTSVCRFAGCKCLPHFLKSRRNQEFCSPRCRALENMKIWRLKPGNRRRENRRKKERLIKNATQVKE
jgi:hypothetical protein